MLLSLTRIKVRPSIVLMLTSLLISGLLFSVSRSRASEGIKIKIFPTSYAGNWQNSQAALIQDLGPEAGFEEFNTENSAYPFNAVFTDEPIIPPPPSQPKDDRLWDERILEFSNFGAVDEYKNTKIINAQLRFSLAAKPIDNPLKDTDTEPINTKISVDWSDINDTSWDNLGIIDLNQEISNAQNGGYWLYALPVFKNFSDLEKLKVRFKYNSANDTKIYLDSLWLEIDAEQPIAEVITKPEIGEPEPTSTEEIIQPEEETQIIKIEMSGKNKWLDNENPQFIILLPKEQTLLDKILDLFRPEIRIKKAILLNQAQQEVTTQILFNKLDEDKYQLTIKKPDNFQPGQYQIILEIEKSGQLYRAESVFDWQIAPKPKPVAPRKRFIPTLEGQPIKTMKKFKSGEIRENTEINVEILPGSDKEEPKIIFSGACQKKYFVVLMYANFNDYAENPTLFIYNKAFPCQNNAYQYKLDDLPENLRAGTYYFLIGEQGESGTWQPISAVQPVKISVEYK